MLKLILWLLHNVIIKYKRSLQMSIQYKSFRLTVSLLEIILIATFLREPVSSNSIFFIEKKSASIDGNSP